MSDELEHFGVKGMKWGVRKDPDPNASTETRRDRAKARNRAEGYMFNALGHEPIFSGMTQKDYEALSTKGETFVKGTNLKRVQFTDEKTLKGTTYVSKLVEDSNFYRAILPAYSPAIAGQRPGAKKYKATPYELDLKTVKKLSSPSDKERFDTFFDILGKPAIKVEGRVAPITGRQYLEDQGYKKIFGTYTDQQLAFRAYNDFVKGQGNKESPINQTYFNDLKNKGYNVLKDGNDSGTYTKNPLIVLDAEKNVKITNIRRLSADEINKAQRQLPDNRKSNNHLKLEGD